MLQSPATYEVFRNSFAVVHSKSHVFLYIHTTYLQGKQLTTLERPNDRKRHVIVSSSLKRSTPLSDNYGILQNRKYCEADIP